MRADDCSRLGVYDMRSSQKVSAASDSALRTGRIHFIHMRIQFFAFSLGNRKPFCVRANGRGRNAALETKANEKHVRNKWSHLLGAVLLHQFLFRGPSPCLCCVSRCVGTLLCAGTKRFIDHTFWITAHEQSCIDEKALCHPFSDEAQEIKKTIGFRLIKPTKKRVEHF